MASARVYTHQRAAVRTNFGTRLLVTTAEKPAQRVLPSFHAVLPLIGKRQTLLLAACAERSIIPKSRQDFRRARIAGRQFRHTWTNLKTPAAASMQRWNAFAATLTKK